MEEDNLDKWFKKNWPTILRVVFGILLLFGFVYLIGKSGNNSSTQTLGDTPTQTSNQSDQIQKLQNEIDQLKKQKSQTIIKEMPAITPPNKSISDIVQEWQSKIGYITCSWYDPNSTYDYLDQAGSGTIIKFPDGTIRVLTNRHVITDTSSSYAPTRCLVSFPGYSGLVIANYVSPGNPFSISSQFDLGAIFVNTPDEYLRNLVSSDIHICSKIATGDQIVVLGYPGIGSTTSITATEGIISAHEGSYYVTSAKVEHGNSGGAAISIKDDCYIGIPSYVEVGSVESLARILDIKTVHN